MNLNKILLPTCIAMLLASALPLHAQNGCVDSPEAPTILLALLAGLGGGAAGVMAYRRRRKK